MPGARSLWAYEMKKNPTFVVWLLFTIGVSSVHAVTPPPASTAPGAVLERSRESRDYLESQRRLQAPRETPEADIIDKTGTLTPAPAAAATRFVLQQVSFSASKILSADELRSVVAPYVGREVSVDELFALVKDVNALYRERKAVAARAILPPQKIEQGKVRIRLVEGQVGQVRLEGNDTTNDAFIIDRLDALQPGSLVFLDTLESELFYFNAVNDIELRAVLKPGETFGTTDYELQVVEPPRYDNTVFIDNAGREDVGLYRLGFNHVNRSLLGHRDDLSFGGHIAEGTEALYAAYNFPLNDRGTRMGFSADYSEIEIIDGDLEPLDVTGDSINAGVFITHPLQVQRNGITNGYVGYSYKESFTDFDGVNLFSTFVRTVTAGVDIERNDISSSWFARFNATGAPNTWGNTDSFFRVNADFSHIQVVANNGVLLLRARGQWTADELMPSSEQFQVGGMSSVRGYPEGLLIGDEGYFGSIEYTFPVSEAARLDPTVNPFTERWRGVLFFDHGAAFPFKGNNEPIDDDDFLTSAGGGVSINLGKRLQARLLVGFPLSSRDDGEDDPRLHFYIQTQPFDW